MKEFTDPIDLKLLSKLAKKRVIGICQGEKIKCPSCHEMRPPSFYGEHFTLCKKCRYSEPKVIGTESVKWELGLGEISRPSTIDLFEKQARLAK